MAEDLARAIVVAAHIMENEEKQRAQEEEYVPEAVLYLVNNYGYGFKTFEFRSTGGKVKKQFNFIEDAMKFASDRDFIPMPFTSTNNSSSNNNVDGIQSSMTGSQMLSFVQNMNQMVSLNYNRQAVMVFQKKEKRKKRKR